MGRLIIIALAIAMGVILAGPSVNSQTNPGFNPNLQWCGVQGSVAIRGASNWQCLLPGTNGQALLSGGPGANPYWNTITGTGTVTSVQASGGATGLTFSGGPITGAGTLTLGGSLGLASGGIAPVGGANTVLKSNGSAASWGQIVNSDITAGTITNSAINASAAIAPSKLATQPALSVLANITGGSAAPTTPTVTALLDAAFSNTQGSILFRNLSGWSALAPGSAGQILTAAGAGANPSWQSGMIAPSATFASANIGQTISIDPDFPTLGTEQARSSFYSAMKTDNGEPVNAFQSIIINGELLPSTLANFKATATPDQVSNSGWALRGGSGTNSIVASNYGAWIENNNHISWVQELDCNNEGATQPAGDDKGCVGLVINTGSTYSPDTGIWIRRATPDWSAAAGPGYLRGITIDGARELGLRIVAMDSTTYPSMVPAAPGTITALQFSRSSDTTSRFDMLETGKMSWGSGSAAHDTSLGRTGAGVLGTDARINTTNVFSANDITVATSAAWDAFTPILTCASGAVTSATIAGKYQKLGKTVKYMVRANISDIGTCSGEFRASLPTSAVSEHVGNGRAYSSGAMLQAYGGSFETSVVIAKYDNTTAIANGFIVINGTYEAP